MWIKPVASWSAAGVVCAAVIISCARPPAPTNRSVTPKEALDARAAWERGTQVVQEIWKGYDASYATALARQLECKVEDLSRLTEADAKKVAAAHAEVLPQLDEQAHEKYLAQQADPRVVNPVLRQYFKDLEVTLPDGKTGTVESVSLSGIPISVNYLNALRDAVLAGRDPKADPALTKIKADYLGGRKGVADAIDAYLAQPQARP